MSDIYAIYGSGGYAREVMPLLRLHVNMVTQTAENQCIFIDDAVEEEAVVNGSPVLSFEAALARFPDSTVHCCIAIASQRVRRALTAKCAANGVKMFSVHAPNALVMDDVIVGEGSVLSPFVTITSNVRIGVSFHANLYSYVAHDCVIGDYVTLAPGVRCNGNIHIGDGAYVGTGVIIHPGRRGKPLTIGENAKIAAGSTVRSTSRSGRTCSTVTTTSANA